MKLLRVTCCVAVAFLNPSARGQDTKEELKQLEGRWIQGELIFLKPPSATWKMIYGRELSTENPVDLFVNRATLVIEGDRFTFYNQQHMRRVEVRIDPTKSPKAVDFILGEKEKLLGVYEIKDGRLYFCIGDEMTRPDKLDLQEGEEGRLRIGFQRQRP